MAFWLAMFGPLFGLQGLGEFARRRPVWGVLFLFGGWVLLATTLYVYMGSLLADMEASHTDEGVGSKGFLWWLVPGPVLYVALWAYGVHRARSDPDA